MFLKGEDSSHCLRKIMCAVSWPQDESFSTSSFLLACFTRFWGTCTNNQKKKLAKNLLWWRKIAKLKTIDHNWTTQVSFRMSEENTAGCQVNVDNFHSTKKKISSLSTKALFPWNSLSKSASDRLIFISVLNILGMGQLKERERMKYYTKMEEDENSEYLLADL